jgi:CRISPR system Cascade subunit CasE
MFLHRVHLDARCKEVRRDLADPYEMHSTLCRAFAAPDQNAESSFLWRLEPETDLRGNSRLILQSRGKPDWGRIGVEGYVLGEPDPPLDFFDRLGLETVKAGAVFRFRIRANPCVTRAGKRLGLMKLDDQLSWLKRKGENHGFGIQGARTSEDGMLVGKQRGTSSPVRIFSVLFDGILSVNDPVIFREALEKGIGHGKAMGLGMLSVVPVRRGS